MITINEEDVVTDEFLGNVDNDEVKSATLYLLIETLSSIDPSSLSDEQCRSELSKVVAYTAMINFRRIVQKHTKKKEEETEEEVEFI